MVEVEMRVLSKGDLARCSCVQAFRHDWYGRQPGGVSRMEESRIGEPLSIFGPKG